MFSSKHGRRGAELLPGSGEALAERIDVLASTVSSAAASIARTDGEIAGLRRELGSGLARVEELAAELRSRARASDVRDLEKKVSALDVTSSRSADPKKRLDDLASKVAVLAERVDTLGATVATAAASIAGRDGEVAAMRRMLDQSASTPAVDEELQRRVEDVAAASVSASARLESHDGEIGVLAGRVETLGERMSELVERVDAAERERGRVTPEDEELQRRVEDVAAASVSASARLESHDGEIGVLAGRVETLGERMSELVERVDAAERERATLAASVAETTAARWLELERALAGLAERLDTVEAGAATVSAELSQATSLWPAALRSLESRVESLAGASRDEAAAPAQPATETHVLAAIQALDQRIRNADAAAQEERELLLERLDRLAGRLDEGAENTAREAEVVPFGANP